MKMVASRGQILWLKCTKIDFAAAPQIFSFFLHALEIFLGYLAHPLPQRRRGSPENNLIA